MKSRRGFITHGESLLADTLVYKEEEGKKAPPPHRKLLHIIETKPDVASYLLALLTESGSTTVKNAGGEPLHTIGSK